MNHLRLSLAFFIMLIPASAFAQSAKLHISYGLTFYYKRQYIRAFNEFRKALAKNPRSAQAHYNIGRVYKVKKQYQQAQKHFEAALHYDPTLVVVQRALISLKKAAKKRLQKRMSMSSEHEFDNAVSAFSDSRNFLALGRKAFNRGNSALALKNFHKAFAEDTKNAEIAGTIAFIYFNSQKNLAMAKKYYERSIKLGTRNPETFYSLGLVYQSLKLYPQAIENLKKAIAYDHLKLRYHLTIAGIYEKTGQFDEAFNSFNRILKLDPSNRLAKSRVNSLNSRLGEYFLSRGDYYFSNSEWEKARGLFQKAIKYGKFSLAKQRSLKERLSISNYWAKKSIKRKQNKQKEEQKADSAYVTTDFTLEEAVENTRKYVGRYLRWKAWIQKIDPNKKEIYLTINKRFDPGLKNLFLVKYKGLIPDDRRVQRYASLEVVGKVLGSQFLMNPQTNETSEKLQPVIQASELIFTHPDKSGELKVKFY